MQRSLPWRALMATMLFAALLPLALTLAGPSASAASSPGYQVGTLDLAGSWQTIQLARTFTDPVVVLGAPSLAGRDPAVARVRNVGPTSFEARIQEWDYLDGKHAVEKVPFMVFEAGASTFGGRAVFAGHADGVTDQWKSVAPDDSRFNGGQTVLTTAVTSNGAEAVTPRVTDIAGDQFKVRLQEQARSDGAHAPERVDFVMMACCGTPSGSEVYAAGQTSTADTATISWSPSMTPAIFGQVSTVAGADAVALRLASKTGTSASLLLQEEASNGESTLAAESIRYVVIDVPGGTLVSALAAPTTTTTPTTAPTTTAPTTTTTAAPTTTTTAPSTTTTTAPAAELTGTCPAPTGTVVRVSPTSDLRALAKAHPNGTTFLLEAGVHRAVDVEPKYGQRFFGERGSSCERLAVMTGAIGVTNWAASGSMWVSSGHSRTIPSRSVPCEAGSPRCHEPQDLYVNGVPQKHVGSKSAVVPGSWFFDFANQQLWMGTNPDGKRVELSTKQAAFLPTADKVTIQGIRMEKFANQPQYGVIGRNETGSGWVIRDNEIGASHAAAVVLGAGSTLVDNIITNQGGIGLKVRGVGGTVTGNVIRNSGWAGVVATWEGGGLKVSTTDATISGNCVHDNRGSGIWADEGAHQVLIDGNTVFGNLTQGIFFEISSYATIRNNLVGQNGVRFPWLYGGQIMVSTSSNALIEGNRVEVNGSYGNGVTVIWQDRNSGTQGVDNTVRNNDVTFLSTSGVTGMRTDFSGGATIYDRNSFSGNKYHHPAPSSKFFRGKNGSMTLQGMQSMGQESGSTIDSTVRSLTWSCNL